MNHEVSFIYLVQQMGAAEGTTEGEIRFRNEEIREGEREMLIRWAKRRVFGHHKQTIISKQCWQDYVPFFCKHTILWQPGFELCFKQNQQPNLLIHIKDIQFPTLQKLDLSGNEITSIESLSMTYMPKLKILQLGCRQTNNHIISVRILRKMQTPNLFDIVLYGNKIKDAGSLTELMTRQLKFLYYERENEEQGTQIQWLVKLDKLPEYIGKDRSIVRYQIENQDKK